MTQDEIIEMAKQAGIGWAEGLGGMPEFLEAFAKLVAAKEREIYDHDTTVLMNALWKSCGDDEEVVRDTINSQGTLIRGKA
jgi:hypothetical protein